MEDIPLQIPKIILLIDPVRGDWLPVGSDPQRIRPEGICLPDHLAAGDGMDDDEKKYKNPFPQKGSSVFRAVAIDQR